MSSASRLVPRFLRQPLLRLLHYGRHRFCPVCESHLRAFLPGGVIPRPDARCPVCDCLERHRLVWTFLAGCTDLLDGRPKRMLHVAPEPQLERRLRAVRGLDYLSGDLDDPRAMVRIDITALPYEDGRFDVIYCSHVLEHVPDDRRALRELCRVLHPRGWAVLQVPLTAAETDEDPSIDDPEERLRRFGQRDHVRRYGPDYEQRLAQAGFRVEPRSAASVARERSPEQLGFEAGETLFFCRKG